MSCADSRCERTPLPERAGGFRQQLLKDWAGGDRQRLRKLAALELREVCGWTQANIALVLGCTPEHARRLQREAGEEIREAFAPPNPRDLQLGAHVAGEGFSDPDEERE